MQHHRYSSCLSIARPISRCQEVKHLLFIVHGMNGDPATFLKAEEQILAQFANSGVHVHRCSSNMPSQEKTHDGICAGGQRIAQEIRNVIDAQKESGSVPCFISFWGHSLGGLYVRHALAHLADQQADTICGLVPCLFLTTACPHLGVAGTLPKEILDAAQWVGLDSQTGIELFLEDSPRIVLQLACENKYKEPLRWFQYRTLAANASNDWVVDVCTAALLPNRPLWLIDEESTGQPFSIVHDTAGWAAPKNKSEDALALPPYYAGHPSHDKIAEALDALSTLHWRVVLVSFNVFPPVTSHICICDDLSWLNYLCQEILHEPLSA